ncbi:DUF4397 domain-containing protein [Citricoccus sp. SGAir0253]|uniref:DUF4397 domain-containing protein n=1 Tax=Citricoccus sp. SGAir0253 TaxID=2567881 RepID=UPI0010CD4A37|nr:DUF4397 domain-containing protein [Citricoccus sp. SGAir0253]QCU79066.1 DUF4397 domain-containing protein [Citricoccus sp. SGAir0253]
MRKALPLAVTATCGLALLGTALPAAADEHGGDAAMLSVLHGVPDTTVDVYVNGERTLDDFEPGDLAGPLELPAGDYEIAITAADAEDDSEPVIGPVDVTLEGGMDYTAAAHLDAEGQPTATAFVNDTSSLEAGTGRLVVRHVAAAPAVDIWADGEVAVPGLENPDEKSLDLPAGTIEAAVSLAGESDPVLGPADVQVTEGAATIVYAWGSAEDGSLALATQTVEGMHSAPGGVPTGNTQVPAEDQGLWWAVGGGALLLAAAGMAAAVRRRSVRA